MSLDFENPVSKTDIEVGLHVKTYALSPDPVDFSESRSPASDVWVVDWNEDKSTLMLEYGPYMDNVWVDREKVAMVKPKSISDFHDKGGTYSFF